MIDDIPETDAPEEPEPLTAEKAFNDAATGFELDSLELLPFSPTRKIAAQAMGMRYPIVGDEGMEQFERTGIYPGAVMDVVIFVWLCVRLSLPGPVGNIEALPVAERRAMRAARKPAEALESAFAFAGDRDLADSNSPAFKRAYDLFIQVMAGESASASQPDLPTDNPSGGSDPNA